MKKHIKIIVPDGYEIDKEKSTFENIVFKKKDTAIIRWNRNRGGVDIITDEESFTIDASQPSYYCNWNDAKRAVTNNMWDLPTVKQLQVLAKYIAKVNEIIGEHNGFEIDGLLWSCEGKGEFCAWSVSMSNGSTNYYDKLDNGYVRAVFAFQN